MKLKQFGQLSVIALALCGTKMAFAGDRGGNGGDALICQDRVILLDYFEAENHQLTLQIEGNDLRGKVSSLLERLAKFDKHTSKLIQNFTDEMVTDIENRERDPRHPTKVIKLSSNVILNDIDDSYEHALPQGCEKRQLVVQKDPVVPEDRLYEIDKSIWDKMDLEQKALTITHEAWYRYSLSHGAKDSRFTRYINGFFAAKESEEINFLQYFERLKKATLLTPDMKTPPLYHEFAGKTWALNPMDAKIDEKNIEFNLLPDTISHNGDITLHNKKGFVGTLTINFDGTVERHSFNFWHDELELANLYLKDAVCRGSHDVFIQTTKFFCMAKEVFHHGKKHSRIGRYQKYEVYFNADKNNNVFDVKIVKD